MRKFAFGRFLVFLLLGLILGTALGIFIGKIFPIFDYGLSFGIPTLNIDLVFLKLTFGIELKLNTGTIIGILIFALMFVLT
ncbi:MAG: DUF4321 domain-containing protein [Caldisericaceae bacterium]